MKLGKIKYLFYISIFFLMPHLYSEEKISAIPLINLENLKPSYEIVEKDEVIISEEKEYTLKKKNKKNFKSKNIIVNLLGLDKITAKTSKIDIKIGDTKKFGQLEIKAIRCGIIDSINEPGEAAYIQVKDIAENQNDKVFVFNGWTFSSNPSFRSIDHAVYDLWLVGCENA